eukprot:6419416-Amphidinium_carterae.1
MRALRTGFRKFFAVLGEWLMLRLSPVADKTLPTEDELRALWCSLSVSADLLDPLLAMKLMSRDGRLHVRETFLEEAVWAEKLGHTLMCSWTIPAWTSSRWLTIGASARGFVAA